MYQKKKDRFKILILITQISMSLSTFKETLKPCNKNPSLISSSSSSFSSISHSFDSSINPRKPPKSSLSQQLLRLQDPDHPISLPQTQPKSAKRKTLLNSEVNDGDDDDDDEEGERQDRIFRPKLESFQYDHTGPYEPLLLSLPGEVPAVQVPASINCRLLEHQRTGVKFLYNLYRNNHGGVLGDDMGLGKTIQSIAFLAAVFGKDEEADNLTSRMGNQRKKKGSVLIVCPSSVIHNWEDEFSKWATFSIAVFHGPNRDLIIEKLEAHEVKILITSFDTYRIQCASLSNLQWEIMIVDEVHRLKNEKSKLYQACLEIKTQKRYGLTGTIMQNC